MRVGFLGIGRMGSAIAGRVLEGGHELTVWNRTPEKAAELAGRGAHVASSVAEACARAEVVMTMLANDEVLLEITLGPGGIVESLDNGAIHVVMGTHGVGAVRTLTDEHADAGQILVAAPVLGRPDIAAAGQLGIVAAGPPDALRQAGRLDLTRAVCDSASLRALLGATRPPQPRRVDRACLPWFGLQSADLRPECTQHLQCDLRVLREAEERLAWQLHHMELAGGDNGCGSGGAVEKAQLSEVVADAEPAGGWSSERLCRPSQDDVQRVS
jgi:hypothetical protein